MREDERFLSKMSAEEAARALIAVIAYGGLKEEDKELLAEWWNEDNGRRKSGRA